MSSKPHPSEPSVRSPARSAPRRPSGRRVDAARRFAAAAARLAHQRHAQNVLLLDVRRLSDVTDYILIATGTSDRQIRAVGHEVSGLAAQAGIARRGQDVDGPTTWLVLDFVDVVVHLFDAPTRAHYDLEMLWGDAPRIRWKRTAAAAK